MKNKYRAIENCKRKIVFSSTRMWFYLTISVIKSLNWTNSGGTCIKVERDECRAKSEGRKHGILHVRSCFPLLEKFLLGKPFAIGRLERNRLAQLGNIMFTGNAGKRTINISLAFESYFSFLDTYVLSLFITDWRVELLELDARGSYRLVYFSLFFFFYIIYTHKNVHLYQKGRFKHNMWFKKKFFITAIYIIIYYILKLYNTSFDIFLRKLVHLEIFLSFIIYF